MGELGDDFAGLTFDDFKELMLGALAPARTRLQIWNPHV